MSKHRPHKVRLSPLQGRLLWLLEEAGEYYLPAALNALQVELPCAPEVFLLQIGDAIESLIRHGYLSVYQPDWRSGTKVECIHSTLASLLFDSQKGAWHWKDGRGGKVPQLVLEEKGKKLLGGL